MDGNGRWAQQRGLPRHEGHLAGVDATKRIVKACVDKKIPILSVWAFGSENWARPTAEVDFLMQLFLQALGREMDELHERGVRICFTGHREALLPELQQLMHESETLTVNNNKLIFNIVMNYGGKWDIVHATKKLAGLVAAGDMSLDEINERSFRQALSIPDLPDPDLFIRTSGEQRLSNFFLWQLAYTELYFSQVNWPDFTATEFDQALESFNARERRYGQTSMQLIEKSNV